MTTIIIENNTLLTDSYQVLETGLSYYGSKIRMNESKTIALAYCGPCLKASELDMTFRRIEIEVYKQEVRRRFNVKDNPMSKKTKEALEAIFDADDEKPFSVARPTLVLSRNFAFMVGDETGVVYCEPGTYYGVGIYTSAYGLYREMGRTPIQAMTAIGQTATLTGGPINVVEASELKEPDLYDFTKQILAGIPIPTMKAAKPPRKPRVVQPAFATKTKKRIVK